MTPDQLDTAIGEELRTEARLAPAAAPVKARVLLATRALAPAEEQPRGLRAWLVPMLAAAAVLLVTLGITAGPKLLSSDGPDRNPPAVGSTLPPPTPSPSATSPSASSSAAKPSSTPTPTTKPSSATTGSRSVNPAPNPAPSSNIPQDWYRGLDVAALPHTPGLCPIPGAPLGTDSYLPATRAVSMPGQPAPLWLVPVTCEGPTGNSHPVPVEVFQYSPDGPRLLQTLAYQAGDQRLIKVTAISVGSDSITLSEQGYSSSDPLCCRGLRFTQTFSWQSGTGAHFVAGPQQDALLPCVGDQLTVTSSPLTSQSGDARGILLNYVNNGDEPCTLTGYPGAATVDAAGQPVADAARTPTGFFGGLTGGDAPRLVLSGSRGGSAVIEWATAQHGGSQCYPDAMLLSTPPGTTATQSYGAQPLVCALQVHPVVAGETGKQPPVEP